MLHQTRDCHEGAVQISSDDDELVLKEKGGKHWATYKLCTSQQAVLHRKKTEQEEEEEKEWGGEQ